MGGKLHAPAVEAEVEQLRVGVFFQQGDESMVAGPGVVCRTFHKSNLVTIGEVGQGCRKFGSHEQQGLAAGYFGSKADKAGFYFIEHIGPVGIGMRPGKLYVALFVPFGGQIIGLFHILV